MKVDLRDPSLRLRQQRNGPTDLQDFNVRLRNSSVHALSGFLVRFAQYCSTVRRLQYFVASFAHAEQGGQVAQALSTAVQTIVAGCTLEANEMLASHSDAASSSPPSLLALLAFLERLEPVIVMTASICHCDDGHWERGLQNLRQDDGSMRRSRVGDNLEPDDRDPRPQNADVKSVSPSREEECRSGDLIFAELPVGSSLLEVIFAMITEESSLTSLAVSEDDASTSRDSNFGLLKFMFRASLQPLLHLIGRWIFEGAGIQKDSQVSMFFSEFMDEGRKSAPQPALKASPAKVGRSSPGDGNNVNSDDDDDALLSAENGEDSQNYLTVQTWKAQTTGAKHAAEAAVAKDRHELPAAGGVAQASSSAVVPS